MTDHAGQSGVRWSILLWIIAICCIPVFASSLPSLPPGIDPSQSDSDTTGYAPGILLVRASDPGTEAESSAIATAHASIRAEVLKDYGNDGFSGLQLISLPDTMTVEDGISYYQTIPGIRYAEPDYYQTALVMPDDPDFWRQWGLSNTGQVFRENTAPGKAGADINAPNGWNSTKESNVIIAVLDSGVDYLHPDLIPNIWEDPKTGTHGYDAITGTNEPMDLGSHGTHCAGIIGSVGNNGIGGSGVLWNATILPVRFLNSFGTGTTSDCIESILWAERNGARIISCSFGKSVPSQAEYEVMAGTDALFICAAGNNAVDTDVIPAYPASYDLDNIISVAATNPNDELASFSNYGKNSVDIGAPGENIYSTKHNTYVPDPIWRDTFDNLSNWTVHGNLTLNYNDYVSAPSSAQGLVNYLADNRTQPPVILSIKEPFDISTLKNPVISYQLQLIGANYSFCVQGSNDNMTWIPLEYDTKPYILLPWLYRECKVPERLLNGPLYIRFMADGLYANMFVDDVTLSDGYGSLKETRYGYMDGTSMAAPFVSGICGILATASPDASFTEMKEALLKSADPIPALHNKTISGGRANLTAALQYLVKPEPDTISLFPGWNHVSVARRLMSGNNTAYELFGTVTNTSGHSVLKYSNTSWITVPADEIISPLSSYWIWTGVKQNINPVSDPVQIGTYSKNLAGGWNGFGVYGTSITSAKNQLSQIGDNWTYVIGYDAASQQYEEPIIRNGTGNQSDSRTLSPWKGYWLYVSDNVTYQVTV